MDKLHFKNMFIFIKLRCDRRTSDEKRKKHKQSRKTENYFTRQSYMNNGLEQFSHWSAKFVQTAILMCQHLGNESVSKIVINDTINFLFITEISILVISNHNSFRVLFDKIAFVYFI